VVLMAMFIGIVIVVMALGSIGGFRSNDGKW
jgi:hypothetical protein